MGSCLGCMAMPYPPFAYSDQQQCILNYLKMIINHFEYANGVLETRHHSFAFIWLRSRNLTAVFSKQLFSPLTKQHSVVLYLGLLLHTFKPFTIFCYRKMVVHYFGVTSSFVALPLTLRKIRSAECSAVENGKLFCNVNALWILNIDGYCFSRGPIVGRADQEIFHYPFSIWERLRRSINRNLPFTNHYVFVII